MKKLVIAAIFSTALIPNIVIAGGSPHFVGPVTAKFATGNANPSSVDVCWKEAGVGNNQSII